MKTVEMLRDLTYEGKVKKLEKAVIKAMEDDELTLVVDAGILKELEDDLIGAGFKVDFDNEVIKWE